MNHEGYHREFAKYYDFINQHKAVVSEIEYLNSLIFEYNSCGKKVLDIGCGTGNHAAGLRRRGHRVIGLDPSPGMVEVAKKKLGSANTICGHVEDLQGIQFGFCYSMGHIINHLTNEQKLLKFFEQVYLRLLENSSFYFECWNSHPLKEEPAKKIVRVFENDSMKIVRRAYPITNLHKNEMVINYHLIINNKKKDIQKEVKTFLRVSLFSPKTIENNLKKIGFKNIRFKAAIEEIHPFHIDRTRLLGVFAQKKELRC